MESLDIKKFVNSIFVKKGLSPVKNFPAEFADGSKTLILTNICLNVQTQISNLLLL
jgi:hypothetical protein